MNASTPPPFQPSSVDEANKQYETGQAHLNKAESDLALTWFRRAVLSDPNFLAAHIQVGLLCRDKARHDSMFQRYVWESFLKAASLDFSREDVHNYFIQAGSQSKKLEEVLVLYDKWLTQEPENPLLLTCKKNVVALSLAMVPQSVGMDDGAGTSGVKRFLLVAAIFVGVLGFAILIAVPILLKSGKLSREHARSITMAGTALVVMAGGAFVGRRLI